MKFILFVIFIYLFFLPKPAHAYLDPGSGSYMLQMLIGLLLSLSYVFRVSLKRLIIFIKELLFRKDEDIKKAKSD